MKDKTYGQLVDMERRLFILRDALKEIKSLGVKASIQDLQPRLVVFCEIAERALIESGFQPVAKDEK